MVAGISSDIVRCSSTLIHQRGSHAGFTLHYTVKSHAIPIRACLPESGLVCQDDPRVNPVNSFPVQAHLLDRSRPEILCHNIHMRQQRQKYLFCFF